MHLRDQPTMTMERDAKVHRHGEGQDRISQLPDEILHYILLNSSLNIMEDIVWTCVLSKRWRNLWVSMPHLAFNCSSWPFHSDSNFKEMDADFAHFVDTSLLLHDTTEVQKFHLQWSCLGEFHVHMPRHLTTWMQYAVKRNVKELQIPAFLGHVLSELTLVDTKLFELSYCVFTCPFLEYMKLDITISGRDVILLDVVSLRRLTRLQLDFITISSVSLKALMSGCPILEYMELICCKLWDPDFSSNSLKIMWINYCRTSGTGIRIAGPNLVNLYFNYRDAERMEVLLENLPCLAEVAIQPLDLELFLVI